MHKRRRKIKWLSIAFGVGATAIFAVSAFFLISNKKEMLQKIALKQIGNSFSNIDFKTYDRLGKEISIISDNVCVDQEGNYIFKNLVSTFTLANGEPLTISAVTTKALREDKTECEFIGNVKLSTESGLLLESEKLFVDSNKKIAKGDTSVVISQQDTQLSAQKYFYDVNSNTFTLSENAQGTLKTDKVSANQLIIRFDDAHGKKMGSMDALGNVKFSTESGLLLESETLFVDCNQKIARGDTSVVISQEDTQLSGQRYFYDANSNIFTLNENAKGTFKTDKISANQLIIRFDDAHGKKVKSMDALGDATYVTQYYTLKAKQNILYTEKEMKARENVSLLYK
ncbi:MAG: LPS export ABC transporter periplasmic protein LptC, partial [Holosporaceae bacterium]|nr:LPS export ABC transporter periplasmic protein LptC [Holosporaceae bacterium]